MNARELVFLLNKLIEKGHGDAPVRWLRHTVGDPWTDGHRVESVTVIEDVINGEDEVILG